MSAARKGRYGLDAPYLLVLPVVYLAFVLWHALLPRFSAWRELLPSMARRRRSYGAIAITGKNAATARIGR